jgi:hypothetical protein
MISLRDVLFLAGGVAIGVYVVKLYFGLEKYAPTIQGLVTPAVVG